MAGKWAPFYERLSNRQLEGPDIELDVEKLPCDETKAKSDIDAALAGAALSSVSSWILTHTVSETFAQRIAAGRAELKDEQRYLFASKAEDYAKRAMIKGEAELVIRAAALCDLVKALEAPLRSQCKAAMRVD